MPTSGTTGARDAPSQSLKEPIRRCSKEYLRARKDNQSEIALTCS